MRPKKAALANLALLVGYGVAANPSITGLPVHEWAGLGILLAVVLHVAAHVDWAVGSARRLVHNRAAKNVRLALDALLVVAFMVCVVSGVMVSGTVLGTFGLYASGYFFWDPLHALSAKVLLALLLVHVALNWKAIAAFCKNKEIRHGK